MSSAEARNSEDDYDECGYEGFGGQRYIQAH